MLRAPQSSRARHQIFACHLNTTQEQYGRQEPSLPPVMPNSSTSLGPLLTHHQQVLPTVKPPSAHQHQTSNPRHPSPAYQQLALPLRQSSSVLQFHQQHLRPLQPRDSQSFQAPLAHQSQTFPQRDPAPAHQQPSTSGSSLQAYSNLPITSMTHLMNPYMDVGASSRVVSSTINNNTQSAMRLYHTNRTEPEVHQGTDGSSSLRTTLHSAFPNYTTVCIPGVGSSQSSSMSNVQSCTLPVQPAFFQSTTSSEPLHTLGVSYQTNSQRSAQFQFIRISDGTLMQTFGSQCNTGGEFSKTANTYHNNTSQSNSSTSRQQSLSQNITRTQNMGTSQMMPVGETNLQGNRILRDLLRLDTPAAIPNAFTDSLRSWGVCNTNSQEPNKAVSRASISTTKQLLTNLPLQIPNEVPFIVPPNWNPAAAAALHSHSQQDDSEQDGTSNRSLRRWYQIPGMEQENTNTCLPTQTYTNDTKSLKSSTMESCTETEIVSPCISNSPSAQMPICTSTSTTNVTSSASFISIPPLSAQVKGELSTSTSTVPSLTETVTMKLMPPTTSNFTKTPILTGDLMTQNTQLVTSSVTPVFQGNSHVLMTLNNVQVQEVNSVSASSKTAGFSGHEPKLVNNKKSFVSCPGLNTPKESNSSSVSPNYNSVHPLGKVQNVNLPHAPGDLSVQTKNPEDLKKEELAQKIIVIDNLINLSKLLEAKKHSGRRETLTEMWSEYATEDTTTANSLLMGQIAESESPCTKNNSNESVNPPSVSSENKEGNIGSGRHVINSDCASNTSANVNVAHASNTSANVNVAHASNTSANVNVAPVTESLSPAASQKDNENGVSSSGLGICILNTFSLAHIGHKNPKEMPEAKNTTEGNDITKKRKLSDKFVTSMVKKSKKSCDKAEDDSNNCNTCISGRKAVLELPVEKVNKTDTDIRKFNIGNVQEVLEISEDEGGLDDVAEEHKRPQSAEKQCEKGSPKEKTRDNAANVEGITEGEVNEFSTLSHVAFTDTIASEMKSCFKIVTFHNKNLLQVETESGKFFIMKELLNKCFENFKQRNYFCVFKAKEYHLKIPVIDLPKKFKPYTIQYLELNQILKPGQSNPDKYISIIEQINAERLYVFDFNKITLKPLSKNVKDDSVCVDSHSQNAKEERPIEDGSNNSSSPAAPKSVPVSGAIISYDPVLITSSDSETASSTDSVDSDCTLPYVDGKARHLVLKRRKTPKKTRPLTKKNRKKQDKSDDHVGGTLEVNGVSVRYIFNDKKRYIPFEDLARSFPQINIYSYLKKGNCPMINCPSNEMSIFNSTDVSLPKLGKNPILVEYDSFQSLVHSLQEFASPAAGSKEKEHTDKSTAKKLLALYSKKLQKLKDTCLAPHEVESSGKDQESCQLQDSTKLKSYAATKPTVTEDMQNSPIVKTLKTSFKMVRTVGKLPLESSDSSITNEKSIFDNKSVQMSIMSKHSYEGPIEKADKNFPTSKDHRMAGHSLQKKTLSAGRELVNKQIRQAMLNKPYVALERLSPIIVRRLMGNDAELLKVAFPFKPQKENSTVTKCVRHHNSCQRKRKMVPLKEISFPIQDHQVENLKKPAANRDLGSDNDTVCSINVCESVSLVNQNTENAEISGQCHIINCKDSGNVSTPGNHDSGGNSFPEDGLVKSIHIHEDVPSKDLESNDGRIIVSSEDQNKPMTVDRDDTGRILSGTEMEHEDIDSNTNTLLNEDVLETSSDQPALCPAIAQRDNTYNSLLEEIQNLIDEGKKGDETTDVNVFPSDYSDHEDFQASLSNAFGLTTSRFQFLERHSESREGDQFFRIGEQFDNILLTESNSVDSLQSATIRAFHEQSQLNNKLAASCQILRTVINQMQRN